jgi:hypothetical protein
MAGRPGTSSRRVKTATKKGRVGKGLAMTGNIELPVFVRAALRVRLLAQIYGLLSILL